MNLIITLLSKVVNHISLVIQSATQFLTTPLSNYASLGLTVASQELTTIIACTWFVVGCSGLLLSLKDHNVAIYCSVATVQ